MDNFFNILRKSIVLTMMVVFGFVFTYVPQHFNRVPAAEAIAVPVPLPVLESGPALAAASASAVANTTNTAKESFLDGIATAIAKAIISGLIASLITWINSGFKGKPAFVTDIKKFLLDTADKAAGEYLNSLGGIGSFICSPFQLDIQVALALKYQEGREKDYDARECRITGVIDNLEDFYDDTFNKSSLEDFIVVTSNPEMYTPYGQLLAAETGMRIRLSNDKGQVLKETDWGQGFMSGKICQVVDSPDSGSEQTAEATTNSSAPLEMIGSDSSLTGLANTAAVAAPTKKVSGKEKCDISKPGKVIADALNKAMGAGTDGLIAADEVNELIGALLGQLANKAMTGAAGLLGLSASTGHTSGGFSAASYVEAAANQANANVDKSTNGGLTLAKIDSAIAIQEKVVAAANQAIPGLLNYANNYLNPPDKRDIARNAYEDASAARSEALATIPKFSSIASELATLDKELTDTTLKPERKQAIAQRKGELLSAFISLNPLTELTLTGMIRSWKPPV